MTGPAQPAAATPLVEIFVTEGLDTPSAQRLRGLLADAMLLRPVELIVDLADCPFAEAVAVDALLEAHRAVWRSGGRLTLRSPTPRVRRIIESSRLHHVFQIVPGQTAGGAGSDA